MKRLLLAFFVFAALGFPQATNITHLGGARLGGADVVDVPNTALRVNVVAGGAGGGAAQTQVRNAADNAWVNVGFNGANLRMPVDLFSVGGTTVTGANVVDGANTAFRVNCILGCGVSSFADNSAFTAGASAIQNFGAVFNEGLAAVTAGNAAAPRITSFRAVHFNLRDNDGNELGIAARPLQVSLANTGANATALKVDGSAVTQPISAASLPLPTGASTSALQTTGNSSLSSIDSKLGTLGQQTMAGSAPVVIASDQSAVPISGTITATGTVTANQGGAPWTQRLQDGAGATLATVTAGNALKVDGSAVTQPVSAASLPLPTGASTEATLALIKAKTDNIDVALSTRTKPADTQTVAGTVTSNIGTTGGLALDATLTSGTVKVLSRANDGTNSETTLFDLDSGAGAQYARGVSIRLAANGGSVEGGTSSNPIRTDPTGSTTQPISGTVTANAGTNLNTSALALSATQTDGTQKSQITDGTRDGTVKAASTAPAATDTALVVTLNPNNTVNSVAYKVDGSAVTQPISAASLPLPSGASTAAKQPALGTAGTASADVITVQGIASMTKLLVTPDSVALPANQSVNVAQVAGTNTVTAGVSGLLAVGGNVANAVAATANPVPVGGIFTTTPATLTTGQTATLQFTAAQNAKQDLATIAGTAPTTAGKIDIKGADGDVFVRQTTASNLNAAVVGTGTAGTPAGNILTVQGVASMTKLLVTPDSVALPANQSVNVAQIAGTNTVTAGVSGLIAVGGNVANAVAATANPVPVGGIFTTTPTTLTTGQTATLQFTAAQNVKHDITTIAGTAPTTVGKLDVKGADGDVFVRQATASNLNAAVVGTGTAGSPAGNILTVQGVASMTKLLVTPDSVALPANQSVNVAQVAAATTATAASGVQKVGVVGNAGAIFDGATGAAPPANVLYQGGNASGATGGQLAGAIFCDQYFNIQQTANTQIITGVAGRRTYICAINLVTATAQNVSVVAGTGSVCATTTVAVPGLSGGATAATGWNFAANGGIALGGGANGGPIGKTTVNQDNVCVFQSGSGQLSGGILAAIL